jgi:HEAT repeat protein
MSDTMIRHAPVYFALLLPGLIGCHAKNEDSPNDPIPRNSKAGASNLTQQKSSATEVTDRPREREAIYEGKPTSYWVTRLQDTSWRTRSDATKALAVLGPDNGDVIPALLLELEHHDPFDKEQVARTSVAATLGTIGRTDPKAISALVERLRDGAETPQMRLATVIALGNSGKDSADVITVLLGALKEGGVKLRATAADSLGQIGTKDPKVTSALINVIDDREAQLRVALSNGTSLNHFHLLNGEGVVQAAVAKALDTISPGTWEKELFARLLVRLNDSDVKVRRATFAEIKNSGNAASAFDNTGFDEQGRRLRRSFGNAAKHDPRLTAVLKQRLDDDDSEVRNAAVVILRYFATLPDSNE